jgi:hypothetical protein
VEPESVTLFCSAGPEANIVPMSHQAAQKHYILTEQGKSSYEK